MLEEIIFTIDKLIQSVLSNKTLAPNLIDLIEHNDYFKNFARIKMEVMILYGSETGNCESISKIVLDGCEESKITAKRITLNEQNVAEASGTSGIWIIVTSSTGQGDPPENAVKFQRALLADEKPDLSNIKYTILGLGDTNYEQYQGFPKRVEKLMKESGAQEFYERGAADEAEGLEEVVEPWMENLWPVLIDLAYQ